MFLVFMVFTVFIWLVSGPKLLNNVRHSATKNPKSIRDKKECFVSVCKLYIAVDTSIKSNWQHIFPIKQPDSAAAAQVFKML